MEHLDNIGSMWFEIILIGDLPCSKCYINYEKINQSMVSIFRIVVLFITYILWNSVTSLGENKVI